MNSLDNHGLVGYRNLGNTCFMNSALQCLRFNLHLTKYIFRNKYTTNSSLTKAYIDLVKISWKNKTGVISPSNFKKELGKKYKTFIGFGQQDSHEMIISLLDDLNENLKENNNSIIKKLFEGRLKQIINCSNCNHNSITYQSFMTLELPLVISNNIDLNTCIKNFTKEEILDEDNLYNCEKCNKKVKATKKMELDILPKYLIIALKRFDKRKKIDNPVNFPLENFIINNKLYNLFATVNHYGSRGGGHYTASVHHPNGNWYLMNDSHCRKISPRNIINSSVYIAFFKSKKIEFI